MPNRRQYKIEQQCGLCRWLELLCRQKHGKEYKDTNCVDEQTSAFWPIPTGMITFVNEQVTLTRGQNEIPDQH